MKLVVAGFGLVALTCFLSAVSWADSRLGSEKRKEITAIYKAVNRAGFGPKWNLSGKANVYVYVTTGAGYVDVSAVGSYMASSKLIDDIYRSAIISSEPIKQISFGEVSGCYGVTVLIQKSRYGEKKIVNHFRLGAFVAELKSRGWNPYVLLRIPDYATCKFTNVDKDNLPILVRRKYTWYNATDIPKDAVINVSASVSPGLSAFLVYMRFILPGIGLLAVLVGFVGGLDRRFPIKIRISIYDWGTLICLLAFFAEIVYYMVFQSSLFGRMIADMWLADPAGKHALMSTIAITPVLFITAVIMLPVRTRLYKGKDEEPELEEIDGLVQHLRKTGRIIIYVCLVFIGYLLIVRPFQINYSFGSGQFSGIFVPIVMVFMSRWMYREYYHPSSRDEDLTIRAKQFASRMGVDVEEVRVVTSDLGKKTICGFARYARKTIYITKKAAEELSSGQMDYLLGHELAHFRDIKYRRRMISKFESYCMVCICMVVCFIMLFTYTTSLLVLWLIGLIFAAIIFQGVYMTGLARRLEYEADIQAVLLTGDVDTAVAALEAVYESRSGKVNLDDDNGIHPKLAKRINAMRMVIGHD